MKKINKNIPINKVALVIICYVFTIFSAFFIISITNKDNSAFAKDELNQIAIVNLDEGITVDGENINYAAKMMDLTSEVYIMTGLEDARSGVESSRYAGYIIIPSTFSESVISLNTTPKKAVIEFAVGSELKDENAKNAMFYVMDFKDKLNENVSYMYIASILNEFHDSQDKASTIMQNDKNDLEVIQAISGLDLVQAIDIPELERLENNIESLNVSSNIEVNQQLIAEVETKYSNYLGNGKTDLEQVISDGNGIIDVIQGLKEDLENINITQNENGENIYQSGVDKSKEELSDYNLAVENNINEAKNSIEANRELVNTTLKDNAQKVYDGSIPDIADLIKNDVHQTVDGVSVAPESVTLTASDFEINVTINNSDSAGLDFYHQTLVNDAGIYANIAINYIDSLSQDELNVLLDGIDFTGSSYGDKDNFLLNKSDRFVETYGKSYETFLSEMLIDINDEVSAKIDVELDRVIDESKINEKISNTLADYQTNVIEGVKAAITNDTLENVIVSAGVNFQDIEDEQDDTFDDLYTDLSEWDRVNIVSLEDTFNNFILQPILTKQQGVQDHLDESYKYYDSQVNVLKNDFNLYDPFSYIDTSEISGIMEDMRNNGSDLSLAVSDKSMEYIDYTNEVYTTTNSNVQELQETIINTDQASKEKITEGLQEALNTRAENSELNTEYLQEFTEKLSYTRLGNNEYKQANEFIVKPMNLIDKSAVALPNQIPEVAGSATILGEGTSSSGSKKIIDVVGIMGILLAAIIIAIGVTIVRITKGKYEKDE